MPTSQEDVQAQRERVEKLRQQVADQEAKHREGLADAHNEIEMAQLQAEEAKLEARLAIAKDDASKSGLKAATAVPLAQAKEQMDQAVAQQKAVEQAEKEAIAKQKAESAGEDK